MQWWPSVVADAGWRVADGPVLIMPLKKSSYMSENLDGLFIFYSPPLHLTPQPLVILHG